MVNEVLRPLGIVDRLVGAHVVDGTNESYIGLDRGPGRLFGTRERDILRLFLAGAPQFHRDAMLAHDLFDGACALTGRERDVLRFLLTDMSEREIAAAMSIGWRTVHQHAVSIFRKFGVKGRTGLMALWLRRNGSISAR